MRLHPREAIVRKARAELAESLVTWSETFGSDLTSAEFISVLMDEVSSCISGTLKYQIRSERQKGDIHKPGGLE